jgi:hypothetical protein
MELTNSQTENSQITQTNNPPAQEIISPKCLEYVQQYNGFKKAAAKGIVGLTDTLYRASRELPDIEFNHFCREVGLDRAGSTFRKLMKIGGMAPRLEHFIDRLPNNWTTLYKLALLKNDDFNRVTKNNLLSPLMTANELNELVTRKRARRRTSLHRDLTIDLSNLEETEKLRAYQGVLDLQREFQFSIQPSREFAELMADLKWNQQNGMEATTFHLEQEESHENREQ